VPALTRRELFRVVGAAALVAKLPACGSGGGALFSDDETAMLLGFADAVIPRDDTPGGADLGALEYITRLSRAFDELTPAIYAGGPFSGRAPLPDGTGQTDDFVTFVELDRASEAAWRQLLDPATGIAAQLRAGLDAALAQATANVHDLSPDDFARLFDAQDDAFRDLVIDLVCEAAFSAPEYGGNPGRAGWRLIHFEGDSLPLGYSQWNGTEHVERPEAPLSTANPSDPEPLTDDVRQILALVIQVLGGRVA
jgi:gluconate 2-dehydrogenase subunit 3-like protein